MIVALAMFQLIGAPQQQITPPIPEMAFACARVSKPGEPILIGLPNGLNKSEVLVSDPSHLLGRFTLKRYFWEIGLDGRLSVTFSSSGGPHAPIFKVGQEASSSTNYWGYSHPSIWPKKVTQYSCHATHGERAADTIKLIKAAAQ